MANIFKKLFSKEKKETLDQGLAATKQSFFSKLTRAIASKNTVDEEFLDNLEDILLDSDVGTETTFAIIDSLEERVKKDGYINISELNTLLHDEIKGLMKEAGDDVSGADFKLPAGAGKPYVIMVVGVNGAGKTTTIGKLAAQYRKAGYSVMLGAADTYRAAAVEQLDVWAERAGVPIIKQKTGSDPSAVVFDTLKSAVAHGTDVVIIDTSGRLHNKKPLMDELAKMHRVMDKIVPGAPNEVLLVLDGSIGQNSFEQAEGFNEATRITGFVVTKLDGSSKGGVVIGLSHAYNVPVRYIGLGERIEDLQVFDRDAFIDSLFE